MSASARRGAKPNAFYAQSGGVTAVINASAAGVIETARAHKDRIGKVYAGANGILGALREELIDTGRESAATIAALKHTPGGAFGSCRYKLKSLEENRAEYERLIEVFAAHNIGYFFYNGGGDSQDTAHKVSQLSTAMGFPVTCIGVPKTVDNDLPLTDCSPGFGSVAKYVAVVMGRHAGWIAAAAGLAQEAPEDPPHIIVFPERAFDEKAFLAKVKKTVEQVGYCVIAVSEGAHYADGRFLADTGAVDAFGHKQLGGVAPTLAAMIKDALGYKYHWAVADYLQRAARHVASATDVEQAYAVGKAAVEFALAGKNAVMPTIVRGSGARYRWSIGEAPLAKVANKEKKLPASFITRDGFGITPAARRYLAPLIAGEAATPWVNGLPKIARLKRVLVPKRLPPFTP
jgi:ATP-dependent phosphofructokinase / diphosphate-dependent phosphofructokinase